ncbi:MAG: outer membrane protein assembly factor BamD [Cardiobacterium sp.]|nr:MAG: outer membrane protein assembly factor BamD [Cardiobacterium sp.]
MQKIILGLGLMGGLIACSSLEQDETVNWSAEKLYQTAKAQMNDGAYGSASKYYTKLLARYPFGRVAQQATLDLAYAYYRDGETEKAQAEIENFIRTYPQHPYIDYAYYMRGVFAYEKDVSIFDRLNPINMAQTDPQPLKQAFNHFDELVRRFPQSEYAEDARFRMLFIKNLLGQHELEIADYYMRKGAYIAAVNRAKGVLEQYEQTPSTPYALALMTRAYRELGEQQLSQDSYRVLQMNFADKLQDAEIQHYLQGDVRQKLSLWQILQAKPKT